MSPRKSSTSSGRPARPRTRYLGVEVAGEPFPSFSPARWASLLQDALVEAGAARLVFRLVRTDGPRAIVRVTAPEAETARGAWNTSLRPRGRLRTHRTWGTLLLAKAWLATLPGRGPAPTGERGAPLAEREGERREL